MSVADKPYNPRKEATGNRDLRFSTRHRLYGDAPATDIDLIVADKDIVDGDSLTETDSNGKPVAIIENKLYPAHIDLSKMQFKTYRFIADACGIPCLLNEYQITSKGTWFYRVTALNDHARKFFRKFGQTEDTIKLSELDFAKMLHRLRGKKLTDKSVIEQLSDKSPDRAFLA